MHTFILMFQEQVVRSTLIVAKMTEHEIQLQMQRDRTEAEAWVAAIKEQQNFQKHGPPFLT